MTDSIFLRQARFPCHIGVAPEERATPQDVLIDVDLAMDLSTAGRSDSIKDTMDYRQVWGLLRECIAEREFHLVEALATQIGDLVLELRTSHRHDSVYRSLVRFPLEECPRGTPPVFRHYTLLARVLATAAAG